MKQVRTPLLVAGLSLALSQPALAGDVAVGLGLSYVFGGGVSVGIKVFSDDERDTLVGAVGLEYQFGDGTVRPTLGAAWLGDGHYIDASAGWNFARDRIDFGVGAGVVDTDKDDDDDAPATTAPAVAPPAPAGPIDAA